LEKNLANTGKRPHTAALCVQRRLASQATAAAPLLMRPLYAHCHHVARATGLCRFRAGQGPCATYSSELLRLNRDFIHLSTGFSRSQVVRPGSGSPCRRRDGAQQDLPSACKGVVRSPLRGEQLVAFNSHAPWRRILLHTGGKRRRTLGNAGPRACRILHRRPGRCRRTGRRWRAHVRCPATSHRLQSCTRPRSPHPARCSGPSSSHRLP